MFLTRDIATVLAAILLAGAVANRGAFTRRLTSC